MAAHSCSFAGTNAAARGVIIPSAPRRAVRHIAAGSPEAPLEATDTVTLDYDHRHRRRLKVTTDAGRALLLDLPRAVALADGDRLLLEDGGAVRVVAAAEPVLEIRAASSRLLLRLAWHLGNRHLPTEIASDVLRIRPDPVIAAMARGLGAEVTEATRSFQPEGGAYAGHPHAHNRSDVRPG